MSPMAPFGEVEIGLRGHDAGDEGSGHAMFAGGRADQRMGVNPDDV
jgi:hypothetical protein